MAETPSQLADLLPRGSFIADESGTNGHHVTEAHVHRFLLGDIHKVTDKEEGAEEVSKVPAIEPSLPTRIPRFNFDGDIQRGNSFDELAETIHFLADERALATLMITHNLPDQTIGSILNIVDPIPTEQTPTKQEHDGRFRRFLGPIQSRVERPGLVEISKTTTYAESTLEVTERGKKFAPLATCLLWWSSQYHHESLKGFFPFNSDQEMQVAATKDRLGILDKLGKIGLEAFPPQTTTGSGYTFLSHLVDARVLMTVPSRRITAELLPEYRRAQYGNPDTVSDKFDRRVLEAFPEGAEINLGDLIHGTSERYLHFPVLRVMRGIEELRRRGLLIETRQSRVKKLKLAFSRDTEARTFAELRAYLAAFTHNETGLTEHAQKVFSAFAQPDDRRRSTRLSLPQTVAKSFS